MDSVIIPITEGRIKYIEDQLESHLKLIDGFTFSDIQKLV